MVTIVRIVVSEEVNGYSYSIGIVNIRSINICVLSGGGCAVQGAAATM